MTEVTTTTGTTTSAQLTPFNFNNHAVRVYSDDTGAPWFSAKDVCDVLEYRNDSDAIAKHCIPKGVAKRDTLTDGGMQSLSFINEGNLYRLIIKSRKPQAVEFERTVMEVILPAIRKTGRYEVPAMPQTITPAQAQHLRELVQLVVESGKQSHGETWNRLHHKMKVNSYLKLRPEQFDAATAYLRGKMDDASIAAIAAKHFPQLAAPAPQQAIPSPAVTPTQVADMVDHRALLAMSYSIQLRLFEIASNNQDRGPGYEMASKIKDLSPADLYVVNVAASQEVWLRTLHRKQA